MKNSDTFKILEWRFIPEVEVAFSEGDIAGFFLFAEMHYDGLCKQAAKQGGLLWGLRNSVVNGYALVTLKSADIDLLAKIMQTDPMIYKKLANILSEMNKEYKRINKL